MSVYQFSLPTKSGELQSLQTYEGKTVREAHVRKVQGYSPQRPCYGDLREPQAQAAPGLRLIGG